MREVYQENQELQDLPLDTSNIPDVMANRLMNAACFCL